MVTLKPCPFCGSAVRINHNLCGEPDGIWCGKCHMFVRWPRIKVKRGETFGDAMERMAKVWNGRYDDGGHNQQAAGPDGFMSIPDQLDDDNLPFS